MRAFERYLTEPEQQRLLRAMRLQGGDVLARRDRGWVETLIHSGMRIGEFSLMTVGDALAALRTGWIFIPKERRKGKRRDHQVLVTAPLREALQGLLRARAEMTGCRQSHETAPLVMSREGGGLTPRMFQLRMKHWARLADLPEAVTPHWLRHTRAKNVIRRSTSNNPLSVVQAALGHASLASTGVYVAIDREELAAGLAEVDGPGNRRTVKRGLRRAFDGRAVA